ncbi:uncharacterized protein PRCAT00002822001 [Priceomyces carsonii]|uniref:uncharacterized protein n=1 Tax=Priceomyces carsonii TaxID=28549 RepID=UPI002EDBABD1|nr:unnamed protein product [Priceomyces carsonii]
MSLKDSCTIDVGYPILALKFINNKTILVAGGGGEGNNGIPNKITAIKCSFNVKEPNRRLQKFREITLPSNEDSPQSLDIARIPDTNENKFSVFVGCNQSSQLIKTMNMNNNIRKYIFNGEEHLRFLDAAQLEPEIKGDVDDYPKIVRLSSNSTIGCLMTSSFPSVIFVFNTETLELNFKYAPTIDVEIKDFNLSPHDDGKTLCYVTSKTIETISTVTSNVISSSLQSKSLTKELQDYNLLKVAFLDNSTVVIAASKPKTKSVVLIKYSITEKKILSQKIVSKKFSAIVAMDISTSKDLIAVAGNDLSVTILNISSFKVIKVYKKLHPFAITTVAFSPNGSKLASGSAANLLHVIKLPHNFGAGKSIIGTLFQYLFMIILVAAIAIFLQTSHENGQLEQYLEISKKYADSGLFYGKEYGAIAMKYAKIYGQEGYVLSKRYGKQYYGVIREKLSKENIDGDDKTKEYFKVDEWDDPTSSDDPVPLDIQISNFKDSGSDKSQRADDKGLERSSEISLTSVPTSISTKSVDSSLSENEPISVGDYELEHDFEHSTSSEPSQTLSLLDTSPSSKDLDHSTLGSSDSESHILNTTSVSNDASLEELKNDGVLDDVAYALNYTDAIAEAVSLSLGTITDTATSIASTASPSASVSSGNGQLEKSDSETFSGSDISKKDGSVTATSSIDSTVPDIVNESVDDVELSEPNPVVQEPVAINIENLSTDISLEADTSVVDPTDDKTTSKSLVNSSASPIVESTAKDQSISEASADDIKSDENAETELSDITMSATDTSMIESKNSVLESSLDSSTTNFSVNQVTTPLPASEDLNIEGGASTGTLTIDKSEEADDFFDSITSSDSAAKVSHSVESDAEDKNSVANAQTSSEIVSTSSSPEISSSSMVHDEL